MGIPSPFEVARGIGDNIGKAQQAIAERKSIDQILQDVQNAPPEQQQGALQQSLLRAVSQGLSPDKARSVAGLFDGGGGLTPFQQVSHAARVKDTDRKISNTITQEWLKFADPASGSGVSMINVPFLSSETDKLIKQNVPGQEAFQLVLQDFKDQQNQIQDLDIRRYRRNRVNDTMVQLQNAGITNPNLLETKLKQRGFPFKERQSMIKALSGQAPTKKSEVPKPEQPANRKMTKEEAAAIWIESGKNREEAERIAKERGFISG